MKSIIRLTNNVCGNSRWRLIVTVGLTVGILAGCNEFPEVASEIVAPYEKNYEIVGLEKDALLDSNNHAIYRTVNRENKGVEPVTIPVVPIEGKEVSLKTGRYIITGYPAGNIFIYDENRNLLLTELVGSYAGVSSLTVDIDASYTVRADGGYDSVQITPISTSLSTDLSAGLWNVGQDIESGDYDITIEHGYAYLHVFEEGKEPIVYELIGGTVGKTDGHVKLKEGQMLRVTKTSMLKFTPRGS
ncbi:hypothetical protein QTL97_15140 [Sporosarcina thermotolerans]|uniref:DUF4397 domain-containing protein n=1 Tax=Sporosarcina thermotolerans TaxID=633404 RepID=A0AAW9AAS3_9BACL|nr:hypothetical protein [Sporosarcina thermotolerans]MDW0118267.1 hypothetical protein [Sporosarcina thermotolerans]